MRNAVFVALHRRSQYSRKGDGEYYADYGYYRQEIREDCQGYCVYCDCHEIENGGDENMNLDHFRPKTLFPYLENDPHNLVWSCGGCNRLKWNHWPAFESSEPHDGKVGFVDRFEDEIWDYIDIGEDGLIHPKSDPATYFINLLALNRQCRRRIREIRIRKVKWIDNLGEMIASVGLWLESCQDDEMRRQFAESQTGLIEIRNELMEYL